MSSGGEPERDDTGLPPVDIEVPDDARELDRDVQAYYREQRAMRRRRRSRRLHGVLGRDGMVVPLLICCLIFALIAGTLLTLFTATSINLPKPGTTASPPASPGRSSAGPSSPAGPRSSAGPSSSAGGRSRPAGSAPGAPTPVVVRAPAALAEAMVTVSGAAAPVDALRPAVLLMVPTGCNCATAITQLADLARTRSARAYIVGGPAAMGAVRGQVRQFGHGLAPAEDVARTVEHGLRPHGLTAVLVAANGSVFYAQSLQHVTDTALAAVLQDAQV